MSRYISAAVDKRQVPAAHQSQLTLLNSPAGHGSWQRQPACLEDFHADSSNAQHRSISAEPQTYIMFARSFDW